MIAWLHQARTKNGQIWTKNGQISFQNADLYKQALRQCDAFLREHFKQSSTSSDLRDMRDMRMRLLRQLDVGNHKNMERLHPGYFRGRVISSIDYSLTVPCHLKGIEQRKFFRYFKFSYISRSPSSKHAKLSNRRRFTQKLQTVQTPFLAINTNKK